MSQAAVRLDNLTKKYPSKTGALAVDSVSLEIPAGEIFGLLGPNGAGKTTTVRMICGLLPPTSGNVYIDGISVRDQPDAIRSRIGLLPEDAGDYKNLTLSEELEYHGALQGVDTAVVRERAGPLLELLDLKSKANHRLKTFSRGMRRKFHLIRSLIHRPRLLLLDEPTAGLDPSVVGEVWDLLKALATEHKVTVVLCSHHLEEVERLCTRVAIIKGKLLIQGTLAELSGGDRRYRLDVVGPSVRLSPALQSIAGVTNLETAESYLRFDVMGVAQEVVPQVVATVVAAGGQIVGLKRDGLDLRSLYRSFVDSGNGSVAGEKHV